MTRRRMDKTADPHNRRLVGYMVRTRYKELKRRGLDRAFARREAHWFLNDLIHLYESAKIEERWKDV